MNCFLHGVARALAETFVLPGPILEVGSYQVPGPGVDYVANVEDLPHADRSVGTVIAMNTFEHVPHFWRGFAEVRRVLRSDGAFLVCCPFYFHIHNHPSDYWRFTPSAFDLLLEDYPQRIIGWH